MEEPLFESRCGLRITKTAVYSINFTFGNIIESWPLSRIKLYRDKIVLKAALKPAVELRLKDIISIEKKLLYILISHNDPRVHKYVRITGVGTASSLHKKLRKAAEDNNLGIKFV